MTPRVSVCNIGRTTYARIYIFICSFSLLSSLLAAKFTPYFTRLPYAKTISRSQVVMCAGRHGYEHQRLVVRARFVSNKYTYSVATIVYTHTHTNCEASEHAHRKKTEKQQIRELDRRRREGEIVKR